MASFRSLRLLAMFRKCEHELRVISFGELAADVQMRFPDHNLHDPAAVRSSEGCINRKTPFIKFAFFRVYYSDYPENTTSTQTCWRYSIGYRRLLSPSTCRFYLTENQNIWSNNSEHSWCSRQYTRVKIPRRSLKWNFGYWNHVRSNIPKQKWAFHPGVAFMMAARAARGLSYGRPRFLSTWDQ